VIGETRVRKWLRAPNELPLHSLSQRELQIALSQPGSVDERLFSAGRGSFAWP